MNSVMIISVGESVLVGVESAKISCVVCSVGNGGDSVSVRGGAGVVNGGCCVRVRVQSLAVPLDDGVESIVVVRGVLDHPDCAISFVEAVRSLDSISVPPFPLALVVAGLAIANAVVEVVLGAALRMKLSTLVACNRNEVIENCVSRVSLPSLHR